MSNPSAPTAISQDVIVKSTPPQHFSILYHDTLKLLLRTHNTLFRTYMALQTLGDGSRITRGLIAAVMEAGFSGADYGTTEQEVTAAINKLREMGFVYVMPRQGKPDELYLMPFLNDQQKAQFQGRTNQLPPPSPAANQSEPDPWENQQEEEAPAPQRQQSTSRRRSAPAQQEAAPLPSTPALSPWWQQHQDHLKFLGAIHKAYPKTANIKFAMEAWEELFSTGEEMTQDEQTEIWNGLQWWLAYWIENNTEEKFIPNLSSFIKKEKWLPEVIAEQEEKTRRYNNNR